MTKFLGLTLRHSSRCQLKKALLLQNSLRRTRSDGIAPGIRVRRALLWRENLMISILQFRVSL